MSQWPDDLPIAPGVLKRLPPEFRAVVEAVVRHYEGRIAKLEAQLRKTPQNSSLPPSSQHPHAKPAAPRTASGKKPGGQPGHEKFERALVPSERVDETIVLKPNACRRCGCRLIGRDPDPLRHQIHELPEIKPIITEYQRHRLTCACF